MKVIDSNEVNHYLTFPNLITEIRQTFARPNGMPQRSIFALDPQQAHSDGLAVLPAWSEKAIAVKAFTYFPRNAETDLETLYSKIILFSRKTGEPIALVDGTSVTYWRTAAVSAVAADFLAQANAKKLLICGTGKLAPFMAEAFTQVRPIQEITIWGRNPEHAACTTEQLKQKLPKLNIQFTEDREQAARQADIISCATNSREPLIHGDWVMPGTHIDLVGSHEPDRRECDSQLVAQASVFVDSRINVLAEAGDIMIPIQEGRFNESKIQAELTELCQNNHPGRHNEEEVTLFKAVGTALSDLAAALLVFEGLA